MGVDVVMNQNKKKPQGTGNNKPAFTDGPKYTSGKEDENVMRKKLLGQ